MKVENKYPITLTEEKVAALCQVTASDNVHFTREGVYHNPSSNLLTCLTDILSGKKICKEKDSADVSVTGPAGPALHHWKSFLSVNGAVRATRAGRPTHMHGAARATAHPNNRSHRI